MLSELHALTYPKKDHSQKVTPARFRMHGIGKDYSKKQTKIIYNHNPNAIAQIAQRFNTTIHRVQYVALQIVNKRGKLTKEEADKVIEYYKQQC